MWRKKSLSSFRAKYNTGICFYFQLKILFYINWKINVQNNLFRVPTNQQRLAVLQQHKFLRATKTSFCRRGNRFLEFSTSLKHLLFGSAPTFFCVWHQLFSCLVPTFPWSESTIPGSAATSSALTENLIGLTPSNTIRG